MKPALLALLALLLAAGPVRADIDTARAALSGGDPAPAVRLAGDGDVVAQELLAEAYLTGRGVPRDPVIAAGWLRKAAEQDSLSAQIMLAQLYEEGVGVEKDVAESTRWLEKAASRGDGESQLSLGVRYLQGAGVAANPKTGVMWIEKAARQGDPATIVNTVPAHA